MRILNTATLEFKDFPENKIPKYAILSHTWFKKKEHGSDTGVEQDEEEGETEYKAFIDLRLRPEAGWTRSVRKVKKFCDVARSLNIEWGWSDTCCINKENQVELGEAINSMWKWYTNSALCMVYLWDVESPSSAVQPRKAIMNSEWFTRGWTLQELLAPQQIRFYDKEWRLIGTRHELADQITRRTGIEPRFFGNIDLIKGASAARRLSWAAGRTTTKPEDIAYCLVGIMDVYMPPRYGSGKKEAFRVLQLEFTKKYRDQSIFAWTIPSAYNDEPHGLLAPDPDAFKTTGNFRKSQRSVWKRSWAINDQEQLTGEYHTSHPIPWVGAIKAQLNDIAISIDAVNEGGDVPRLQLRMVDGVLRRVKVQDLALNGRKDTLGRSKVWANYLSINVLPLSWKKRLYIAL